MSTKPDPTQWAVNLRAELATRLGEEGAQFVFDAAKTTLDGLFQQLQPVTAIEVACLIGRIANEQSAPVPDAGHSSAP